MDANTHTRLGTGEWTTTRDAYTRLGMPRMTFEERAKAAGIEPVCTVEGRGRFGERMWASTDIDRLAELHPSES